MADEIQGNWTPAMERAAFLVAEGSLTDQKIADELSIHRDTLSRWKRREDFQKRTAEQLDKICASIRSFGIGNVNARVRKLDDRWNRLHAVIDARKKRYTEDREAIPVKVLAGEEPEPIPEEAETGLIVREEVPTKTGGTIVRWSVDTGLLAEIRNHEKQAAQELGQWIQKVEAPAPDEGRGMLLGGPAKITVKTRDDNPTDTAES